MNGAGNADSVKANIITRRNVNILVDTAMCVAAIKVLSVVEEEKEETGTPTLDKTKDTDRNLDIFRSYESKMRRQNR